MFSKFINYLSRIIVIIVGIVLVTGILNPRGSEDTSMMTVIGVVCILFGIYRIVTYHTQLKRYNFNLSNRNEDEEE